MSDPYAQVASIFASRGVPDYIWRSIMEAESNGNPNAVGDNGNSIGLFQLNTNGGQGTGYEPHLLMDPYINAEIAVNPISDAWQAVKGLGLTPSQEAEQVAIRSGHPGGSVQQPADNLLSSSFVKRIGAYASEFTTGSGGSGSSSFGPGPFTTTPVPQTIQIAGVTLPNPSSIGSSIQSAAAGAQAAIGNPLQSVNDFFTNLNKDISQTDWKDLLTRGLLVFLGILAIILVLVLILSEQYTKAAKPIAEAAGGISSKAA